MPCFGPDRAAVQVDDGPRDRESEPGSAPAGSPRGVDTVEAVKDALDVFGRHPGSLIADLDANAAWDRHGAHLDFCSGRAMPDGVGEQVGQYLVDLAKITVTGQRRLHLGNDAHAVANRRDLGHRIVDDLRYEVLPRVDPDRPRLELGQLKQLVDEPAQPLGRLEHGADRLAVERLDTVGQVLQPGPERGDGSSQLVTDVRD